jgi:hypothetical protein
MSGVGNGLRTPLLGLLLGLLIGVIVPCATNAQIGYPGPKSNFNEQKVGTYTLPDPLTMEDGTRVRDTKTWIERRRPEIVRLFEESEYGRSPGRPPDMSFEVFDKGSPAFDGAAIRKQITIYLTADKNGPKFDLLLYTPADAKKPVPVLLNLGFSANSAAVDDPGVRPGTVWGKDHQRVAPPGGMRRPGGLPIPRLLREGYGVATFYYGDVEPDSADGLPYGIRAHYLKDKNAQPAPDEWGAIAAWAWGMSRAEDYLETDPAVDAKRVAIFGVSRLGKTVMWAGAHDQRFALVIASCSGEGGASLSRRDYGETVADMNRAFAYQFAGNYTKYGSDVSKLPVDANLLVALIAPRPLLLQTGSLDLWSDPKGEFLAEVAAQPVYDLFGQTGLGTDTWPPPGLPIVNTLGYFMHDGGHGVLPDDWQVFINYLNINLRAKSLP